DNAVSAEDFEVDGFADLEAAAADDRRAARGVVRLVRPHAGRRQPPLFQALDAHPLAVALPRALLPAAAPGPRRHRLHALDLAVPDEHRAFALSGIWGSGSPPPAAFDGTERTGVYSSERLVAQPAGCPSSCSSTGLAGGGPPGSPGPGAA